MRNYVAVQRLALALLFILCGVSQAADEDTGARVKEMLRRTQEALREAQSENVELKRAKAEAEQKLLAVSQQLESAQTGSKAAGAAQASLNAKLNAAAGSQAQLERRLGDQAQQLTAANAKLGESGKQLAATQSELATAKQSLERLTADNTSCEAKNLLLYQYGQQILREYKSKGVWASLSQKEPVFGLKQVAVENVVQQYQEKLDGQKVTR